jgi:orotidine-5'-phosphate decarboxylase
MTDRYPLIVAIDTADPKTAIHIAEATAPYCAAFKIGTEFFYAHDREGYGFIQSFGKPIMLDLKLHDIPSTVARTIDVLAPLKPWMLTVHAAGGVDMMEAARDALKLNHLATKLIAVTTLTSSDASLHDTNRLAYDAMVNAAMHGLVCGPRAIRSLRAAYPEAFLVVPGIRLVSVPASADHRRTATPHYAMGEGADYIVVGRPITEAENPAEAAQAILRSAQRGLR